MRAIRRRVPASFTCDAANFQDRKFFRVNFNILFRCLDPTPRATLQPLALTSLTVGPGVAPREPDSTPAFPDLRPSIWRFRSILLRKITWHLAHPLGNLPPARMNRPFLGIAVIGAGRAGMIHAGNFLRSVPDARLVALADPLPAVLQQAGEATGIRELCDDYRTVLARRDVDAVVIATPTALHEEIAVAAAHAGKHILCEKPMAMTTGSCDAMIAAAERQGVVLQIGFMRRFSESFVQAKARIDAGEIGAVVQVRSLTHGPSYPRPWMFDLKKSNGPLAEVNSHDFDTVRWFTGSDFAEVHAIAGNYRCPEARAEFPDFYDQVLLTARMANGTQGCISGAQGVQYAYDARCEILGTHGLITIGTLQGSDTMVCTRDRLLQRPAIASWTGLFRDAYLAEDVDFVDCIRTGRPPRAGGRDGRAAVAAVNAGNASIRARQPQSLTLS